jgi:hypothetical protein
MTVDLGLRRDFTHPFIIADVSYPIIGADFLLTFNLLPTSKTTSWSMAKQNFRSLQSAPQNLVRRKKSEQKAAQTQTEQNRTERKLAGQK